MCGNEPIVEEGCADVLIAFERLEALRYAHFLKPDGVLIVNDQRIDPMTVVTGAAEYPEGIIEGLSGKYKVISLDAMEEAKKLGNPRVFNTIIVGVAAKHMDFAKEDWLTVIEKTVPPFLPKQLRSTKKLSKQDSPFDTTVRRQLIKIKRQKKDSHNQHITNTNKN